MSEKIELDPFKEMINAIFEDVECASVITLKNGVISQKHFGYCELSKLIGVLETAKLNIYTDKE